MKSALSSVVQLKAAAGLVLAMFIAIPVSSWGAVQKPTLKPSPILKGSGTLTGGQAGQTLGLTDIRHFNQPKSTAERLILDFGKSNLQPLNGIVGYYHAELQQSPPRLAVELPLTLGSKISEKEVIQRMAKSRSIKKVLLSFDRTSQSTNLILQFKTPMMIRMSRVEDPKSPGKLVVDLMPMGASTAAKTSNTLRK